MFVVSEGVFPAVGIVFENDGKLEPSIGVHHCSGIKDVKEFNDQSCDIVIVNDLSCNQPCVWRQHFQRIDTGFEGVD